MSSLIRTDDTNALVDALLDLGVDAHYWDRRPRLDEDWFAPLDEIKEAFIALGERSRLAEIEEDLRRHTDIDWDDPSSVGVIGVIAMRDLSEFARPLVKKTAMGEPLADVHVYDQILQSLSSRGSRNYFKTLIDAADELVEEGEASSGIPLYERVLSDSFRPQIDSDLGCLMVYRAGEGFVSTGPPGYPLMRERGVEHSEILSASMLTRVVARSRRTVLLGTALKAYGRAYSGLLDDFEDAFDRGSDQEQLASHFSNLVHTLEGLGLVLLAHDHCNELDLLARAFHWLVSISADAFGLEAAPEFLGRINYALGVAHGREGVGPVQTAANLLASPLTEDRMRELIDSVGRQLQSARPTDLDTLRNDLSSDLAAWGHLPQDVRDLLVQSEYLYQTEHPADFDWAPVSTQYARLTEKMFQEVLGRALSEHTRTWPQSATELQGLLPRRATFLTARLETFRFILERMEDNSALQAFCKATGHKQSEWRSLLGPLRQVIYDFRTPAVHGSRPMARATVTKFRRLLIGGDRSDPSFPTGLLERLAGLAQ